ncbi:MAG: galactonate dehydratase [Proteobacteria bacterium]|nr:galactonate dehydratase [Pseudomonadota bacterium]HAH16320.1 galactonate dehydratase [Chloroflexota bacterium]NBT19663.1 galactonate dehydratase [Pseudomonadota bacterium]NBY48778.1 galactonate dehydratase [Pseudomonadota bacterium]NDB73095.1 galactonate dehydratase [Pseudomonadota bacterium]
MKIVSLELIKVPPSWVWLKIHTDEGITGLGEPYLENHPDSVIAEVLRLEPLLIGEDPRRIEWLWNRMYEGGSGYKGGPVKMSAISGIDMALWDITGKAAGLPVHRLLGGATRDRVLVYRAVGGGRPHVVEPGDPYRAGRRDPVPGDPKPGSPEAWRAGAAELVHEWGFRALKAHVSPGETPFGTDLVDGMVACFAAAREGAGPGVPVAIDIHNPHPAIARQMLRALAPHRPLFVEEPMPIERVDALAEAVAGSEVPVAAGERWMGKWIFFDALSRGLLAVVQPDLAHAGGITECRKIAAIAEAAYATVALHCPLSPLAFAASVQLDASIPNFLVQEHNEVNDTRDGGRTVIGAGYLRDPFVVGDDGCVEVPNAPGLGVEIDEAGMARIMAKPWSTQRG